MLYFLSDLEHWFPFLECELTFEGNILLIDSLMIVMNMINIVLLS